MTEDSVDDDMPTQAKQIRSDESVMGRTTTGCDDLIEVDAVHMDEVDLSPAFDSFYAATRPAMVRAFTLAFHDEDLGADTADEAMVRACQNWSTVRHLSNPSGWVYRVGLNWANSSLRTRRRHRAKQALLSRSEATRDALPEIDLHLAMADLSASHRAVVVCRYFLDWSVAETAESLGVPPGTVKSRLARALAQLETVLSAPKSYTGSAS